jgi:ATP-dependent helicase HrpB
MAMARFGAHPRLAHLLLTAAEAGEASAARAAILVALLEERDILRGDGRAPPVDLRLRVDAVERDLDAALLAGASVDRSAVQRIREAAHAWRRRVEPVAADGEAESVGALLALAFPERVAKQRGGPGRFVTAGGRGARLHADDPLAHEEWLAIAEVDDAGREGRILLAAPLDADEATAMAGRDGVVEDDVGWDDTTRSVRAVARHRLGAIVLTERPLRTLDPERLRDALIEGVQHAGIEALPWPPAAARLRQRLAFLHHHDAAWPDVSDGALHEGIARWLGPHLDDVRSLEALAPRLEAALLGLLDWAGRAALDRLAPERIAVPSGSRIAVDYAVPEAPVLAVRLQEVFGMADTPRLMDGRVPVMMRLLSPAHRPVQQTRDLASFWRSGYFDVRKDLRGRYPRHHWPEDPLTAEAVRGTKR